MGKPKREFTPEEITYAHGAWLGGVGFTAIGAELNCDPKTAELIVMNKIFGRAGVEGLGLGLGLGPRPSQDLLKQRDERLSVPHRDLTGELMNDPRVGQSALDKKMGAGA